MEAMNTLAGEGVTLVAHAKVGATLSKGLGASANGRGSGAEPLLSPIGVKPHPPRPTKLKKLY